MRHMGGGGSGASWLEIAMPATSSSSLESSLEEIGDPFMSFNHKASLVLNLLLGKELGLLIVALFFS
jgi:hypothetical protein